MDKRVLKYVELMIIVLLIVTLASPLHQWIGLTQSVIAQTKIESQGELEELTAAEAAITEAVIAELLKGRTLPVTPEVRQITIAGDYALASWIWGEAGGESLVKLDRNDTWQVIESGGGAMDITVLQRLGVPATEAEQLLQPENN